MRTTTIRIGKRTASGYSLTLDANDGMPPVKTTMPRLDVAAIRRALLEAEGPTPGLADIGRTLHEHLCHGDVGKRWKALARNPPLRTLLDIADPELRGLPWELMHDRHTRVATREDLPIARIAQDYAADGSTVIAWPLRILVIVGIGEADRGARAEEELDELPEALRNVVGLVDVEHLRLPSRERIRRACKTMRPHVVHVISHGDMDEADGPSLLIVDGETGDVWTWKAADIQDDLADQRPRLVVLNACRSGDIGEREGAWGVADALLDTGVGAVIGMHGDISGPAAAGFSAGLYHALAEGQPVDVALARARQLVVDRTSSEHRDWALPLLVTATPPEDILSKGPPMVPAVRNHLERQIRGFVDRGWPRRELCHKLSLGPDADEPEVDLLSVAGPPQVGKSEFVRWCIHASALNGRNVAYVNLATPNQRLPFLSVLGRIANELSDNMTHGERNEAAFDAWRDQIDRLLGPAAIPRPEAQEHRYHRIFPADPPETAYEQVFSTFVEALREAAGGEALVIALDHVGDRTVSSVDWTKFLFPRLLKKIMLNRLEPVRVILVASDDYRALFTGITSVELGLFPQSSFDELVRSYLFHHEFERSVVDRVLHAFPKPPGDWEPGDLAWIVKLAARYKAADGGRL